MLDPELGADARRVAPRDIRHHAPVIGEGRRLQPEFLLGDMQPVATVPPAADRDQTIGLRQAAQRFQLRLDRRHRLQRRNGLLPAPVAHTFRIETDERHGLREHAACAAFKRHIARPLHPAEIDNPRPVRAFSYSLLRIRCQPPMQSTVSAKGFEARGIERKAGGVSVKLREHRLFGQKQAATLPDLALMQRSVIGRGQHRGRFGIQKQIAGDTVKPLERVAIGRLRRSPVPDQPLDHLADAKAVQLGRWCVRVQFRLQRIRIHDDAIMHADETPGLERLIIVVDSALAVGDQAGMAEECDWPAALLIKRLQLCFDRLHEVVEGSTSDQIRGRGRLLDNDSTARRQRRKAGRLPPAALGQLQEPGERALDPREVVTTGPIQHQTEDTAHLLSNPLVTCHLNATHQSLHLTI